MTVVIVHRNVSVTNVISASCSGGTTGKVAGPSAAPEPSSASINAAVATRPDSFISDSTAIMLTKPRLCWVRLGRRVPNTTASAARPAISAADSIAASPPRAVAKRNARPSTASCSAI